MSQLDRETEPTRRTTSATQTMVKDPVCGMEVDTSTAHNQYEYKGKTYYFCSGYCLGMFCTAPARYAQN